MNHGNKEASNSNSNSNSSDEEEDYFSESSYEADETHIQVWKCEFCKKVFKSEAQFDNHLKSKKHLKTLKRLEKK